LAGEPPSFVYVPELGTAGSRVALSPDEAHYLARVCRARVGDVVRATDGRGAIARLRIASLDREASAEVESVERGARVRRARVWCGPPDGERADWLIEKLAELGVEIFQPLECERGKWTRAAERLERWRRLSIAALRQSHRRFLMEIREPLGIEAGLGELPRECSRSLASMGGRPPGGAGHSEGLWVGAIGPAGGFTHAESTSLEAARFVPMCLSDGRLRTETAALAWAAWWAAGGQ
jgi:16S rRNA (uracil1498-N3)-methyltransferase